MRNHDEQQTFQQIAGVFDEPAFLRRARRTENAWTFLLERAGRRYRETLEIPLMRLARLRALSDEFSTLSSCLDDGSIAALSVLFEEHTPQLKRAIEPTSAPTEVVKELRSLVESFERFNAKWMKFVGKLDYDRVNELRDGYNKYYVLEKECALQSFQTASNSFQPLADVSEADVFAEFPPLSVPKV